MKTSFILDISKDSYTVKYGILFAIAFMLFGGTVGSFIGLTKDLKEDQNGEDTNVLQV